MVGASIDPVHVQRSNINRRSNNTYRNLQEFVHGIWTETFRSLSVGSRQKPPGVCPWDLDRNLQEFVRGIQTETSRSLSMGFGQKPSGVCPWDPDRNLQEIVHGIQTETSRSLSKGIKLTCLPNCPQRTLPSRSLLVLWTLSSSLLLSFWLGTQV